MCVHSCMCTCVYMCVCFLSLDLVPKTNVEAWLKHLRNEFPTVPFKANTQSQKHNLVGLTLSLAV